jgi:phosphomannomutase
MNKMFLFDIDGTITLSRKNIDSNFKDFFTDFCRNNTVCFVTGSDKSKTIEQIGKDTFNLAQYSFNCAGNELWQQDKLIQRNEWEIPSELLSELESIVKESEFTHKTGRHIEPRTGMVNISIPGRNCTVEQRHDYIRWDKETREREHILNKLNTIFPGEYDIYIGGETGLDIFPVGKGKIQALEYLDNLYPDHIFYYFGDQIKPGYNDYDIAMKCDHNYKVKSWTETYEILSYFVECGVCE